MQFLLNLLNRQLRGILGNYKTTLGGVAMILHAAWSFADLTYGLSDGRHALTPEVIDAMTQTIQGELIGGFVLLFAKDATKTGT